MTFLNILVVMVITYFIHEWFTTMYLILHIPIQCRNRCCHHWIRIARKQYTDVCIVMLSGLSFQKSETCAILKADRLECNIRISISYCKCNVYMSLCVSYKEVRHFMSIHKRYPHNFESRHAYYMYISRQYTYTGG